LREKFFDLIDKLKNSKIKIVFMFITILAIVALIVIFLIGKKFKQLMIGEIIIALILGLSVEILLAPVFKYNNIKLTLFFPLGAEKIYIGIVLAWSVVLSLATLMTRFLQKKIIKKSGDVVYLLCGIFSLLLIGASAEIVGYNLHLWEYTTRIETNIPIFNTPIRPVMGWLFFGSIFLIVIRVFEDEIEKIKFIKENFNKRKKKML
jgi:hypothetical protein